jgi:hypothetical protein
MARQRKLVVFIKNGGLAIGFQEGAGIAGFISMPRTLQHLYCTEWDEGGCDQ